MRILYQIVCISLISLSIPNAYSQTDSLKKITLSIDSELIRRPSVDNNLRSLKELELKKSLIGKTGPNVIKPNPINHFMLKIQDQTYILDSSQVRKIKPVWIRKVELVELNAQNEKIPSTSSALIVIRNGFSRLVRKKLYIK